MFDHLLQLFILFFVIFDPPASLVVFFSSAQKMGRAEKGKIGFLAVSIAGAVSLVFLLFGTSILTLLNTSIIDFRVAGGIVLAILGIKMVTGQSFVAKNSGKADSARAIAAVIGTPLLTGPAAISAIILSVSEYGIVAPGIAIALVLAVTALMFYQSFRLTRLTGRTAVQVTSTILGLITLAWGVGFVRAGLGV